jgi:hypothetical protein
MPMRGELSIPAIRDGRARRTVESVWRGGVGMLRSAHTHTAFRPNPPTGAFADFCTACLWSALGLTLTGLLFSLGLGSEIGRILAMAG